MKQRRQAWNGNAPKSEADARRVLLEAAQTCIDRHGFEKVGLSDVAAEAGVTRQTVYRYFATAEELFNLSAALASGGFFRRERQRMLRYERLADRLVETLVVSVREIPKNSHLSALVRSGDAFVINSALKLSFTQDEMRALSDGDVVLSDRDLDELAEILLRLLKSFLDDPGPERTEDELRRFFRRWLRPAIDDKLMPAPRA